jgi:hypothetical protein
MAYVVVVLVLAALLNSTYARTASNIIMSFITEFLQMKTLLPPLYIGALIGKGFGAIKIS